MSLAADRQLARIVEKGDLTGAFFLHGDAVRLRDQAARRLTEAALEPSVRDFNLDVFRGAETVPETLAAALAMPPVMAPRRVVAVYDADRLSPRGCAVVQERLAALPPDLTLIVTATIPKGSRKALYRSLMQTAVSLEWKTPREAEIPGWLVERAHERYGVDLALPAAEALAAAVGSDPSLLDAELEKLAGACDGEVTLESVTALVPNVRQVNRWAWLDLVASRHYGEARRQLPALLTAPDATAVGLISAMVDQHLLVGIALEGGARLVQASLGEIGKPYLRFKARTYAAQARNWTGGELETALRLLRRADMQAKRSGRDRDGAVLGELLLLLEQERRRDGRTAPQGRA